MHSYKCGLEPRKANEECKFDRSIVLGKDIRQQQFNGKCISLLCRLDICKYISVYVRYINILRCCDVILRSRRLCNSI